MEPGSRLGEGSRLGSLTLQIWSAPGKAGSRLQGAMDPSRTCCCGSRKVPERAWLPPASCSCRLEPSCSSRAGPWGGSPFRTSDSALQVGVPLGITLLGSFHAPLISLPRGGRTAPASPSQLPCKESQERGHPQLPPGGGCRWLFWAPPRSWSGPLLPSPCCCCGYFKAALAF